MNKWIGGLIALGLLAIGLGVIFRPPSDPEQMADALFFNGKIVTMARLKSGGIGRAPALAIKDGRILKLGMLQSMKKLTGPQTRLIDLKGGALYPGFIEAHASPLDSLKELQTAVMRQADADGSVIAAKGTLNPEQALEAIIINAARQISAEDAIGTLEKGKRANLVWLSADPLSTPVENWHEIEVLQVWIDGNRASAH